MRHFLKKSKDILVQDYIAGITKINNYLAKSTQSPRAGIPPSYQTTNY